MWNIIALLRWEVTFSGYLLLWVAWLWRWQPTERWALPTAADILTLPSRTKPSMISVSTTQFFIVLHHPQTRYLRSYYLCCEAKHLFLRRCCPNTIKDPFYLTEHRDATSRALHVVGTSLVFLVALSSHQQRQHIPNLAIGLSCGSMLCEFLSPFENGLFEFAIIIILVAVLSRIRGQPESPWRLAVLGYFFAWVGHFFFEGNRPATFVYPSYSLLSDFYMWYETLTGNLNMQ